MAAIGRSRHVPIGDDVGPVPPRTGPVPPARPSPGAAHERRPCQGLPPGHARARDRRTGDRHVSRPVRVAPRRREAPGGRRRRDGPAGDRPDRRRCAKRDGRRVHLGRRRPDPRRDDHRVGLDPGLARLSLPGDRAVHLPEAAPAHRGRPDASAQPPLGAAHDGRADVAAPGAGRRGHRRGPTGVSRGERSAHRRPQERRRLGRRSVASAVHRVSAPAAPRIRAVVFDLGGVLIDWDPRHLYRTIFADETAMEDFLKTVTTPEWNRAQDAGRPWAEAVEELIARHPERREQIEAYRTRWMEMLGDPIQPTVDILDELRAVDVALYALSNWSAETFPVARPRYHFLEWFDGIV